MITKQTGVTDGLNAAGDFLDLEAVYQQPASQQLVLGTPFVRDVTQLVNSNSANATNTTPSNIQGSALFVNQADQVVLATSANGGDVMGCYQGALTSVAVASATSAKVVPLRKIGVGWVWAGAVNGGTAINVGTTLVSGATASATGPNTAATYPFAIAGTRAIGTTIGRVLAYPINTNTTAAVTATGSQTVTVANAAGITATTPVLTVDVGTAQEAVTPTAVVQGAYATQTFTVAGTVTAGAVLTANIGGAGGYPATTATYTTVTGDTATTAANGVRAAINAAAAVAGLAPFLQLSTNNAGVITVNALTPGTAQNVIPTTVTTSNLGTTTFVAGGATMAGGTNSSFTAVFAKTHATNVPVVGIATTGSVLAVPGVGYNAIPVLAEINIG